MDKFVLGALFVLYILLLVKSLWLPLGFCVMAMGQTARLIEKENKAYGN
jgi:hypothetical protein